jgi:phosphonate transport system substrate-binding protein
LKKKMMMKKIVLLLALFSLYACNREKAAIGTKNNPIKMYFTPSVDAGTIAEKSDAFVKFLEKETGLFFKTEIPQNYVAVVESFGSGRADVAIMNSFGYLMAHSKYGAMAKLTTTRYGSPYYRGQILASSSLKIDSLNLAALSGKKFAYVDAASTSGYILPSKMLKESGVQLGEETFAMKHDNVVIKIYQGQVDAGATFYSPPAPDGTPRDARTKVLTQFPDVMEKVKIIALTEEISNDPVVFNRELPENIIESISNAFIKFTMTDEGKKIFTELYAIDGFKPATDNDYNDLRNIIKMMGKDLEEFVK